MVNRHGNSCRLFALLNISCILYIVTDNGGNVFQWITGRQYFAEDFTN